MMKFGKGIIADLVKKRRITKQERNEIITFVINMSGTAFAVGILLGLTIAVMVL